MKLRERLKEKADELSRLCDGDYPELILALNVASLFRTAMALCGEHLAKEMGRVWANDARRSHGLCQDCDTEINPALTHHPLCERCDARVDAECRQIDKEVREYEQNGGEA